MSTLLAAILHPRNARLPTRTRLSQRCADSQEIESWSGDANGDLLDALDSRVGEERLERLAHVVGRAKRPRSLDLVEDGCIVRVAATDLFERLRLAVGSEWGDLLVTETEAMDAAKALVEPGEKTDVAIERLGR